MINKTDKGIEKIIVKYDDGTEKIITSGIVVEMDKDVEDDVATFNFEFTDFKGEDLIIFINSVFQIADEMGMLDESDNDEE